MSQSRYIVSGILELAWNQAELYFKVIKPVPYNADISTHMKIPRSPWFGQKYSKYDRIGLGKRISRPQPVQNPLLIGARIGSLSRCDSRSRNWTNQILLLIERELFGRTSVCIYKNPAGVYSLAYLVCFQCISCQTKCYGGDKTGCREV
jgi:hypothetical protein